MEGILKPETLVLFFFFVVPGFVTVQTYDLFVPSERRNFGESFVDIIAYSFLVLTISIWPFLWVISDEKRSYYSTLFALSLILIFFVVPIGLASFYYWVRNREFFQGKIVDPSPTAWDKFFGEQPQCYVLFHLKSEEVVGGFYGSRSSASSYPQEPQVHVEEVWDLNEKLEFVGKRPNTAGAIIDKEDCNVIELFFKEPESGEHGKEDEQREDE